MAGEYLCRCGAETARRCDCCGEYCCVRHLVPVAINGNTVCHVCPACVERVAAAIEQEVGRG